MTNKTETIRSKARAKAKARIAAAATPTTQPKKRGRPKKATVAAPDECSKGNGIEAKNGRKRGRKSQTEGISYTFSGKDGGQIKLNGLTSGQKTPDRVASVLVRYGFEETEPGLWIDVVHPIEGETPDEMLATISTYAPVTIALEPPKTKRSTIKYRAQIGAGDEMKADTMLEALLRAHQSWNKHGRDIKDINVETAIHKVLG